MGPRTYVFFVAVLTSLNNILLGYDIGIMAVARIYIRPILGLTTWQDGLVVGVLNASAALGGLLTGPIADQFGRRLTMVFAACFFLAGALISCVATSFALLFAGRIVTGIGCGIGAICSPLLLSELAPAADRGMAVGWTEVINNVGICLGFFVGDLFSAYPVSWNWRLMLGIGCGPPVLILLALTMIPESPRWLTMRGRMEEARVVLDSVSELHEGTPVRRSILECAPQKVASWSEVICPSKLMMSIAIVGWGVPFLSQATGTEAVVYFAPAIMKDAHVDESFDILNANVVIGIVKTSVLLLPMMLLDSVGRRPMLVVSVVAQAVTAIFLAGALKLGMAPLVIVVALCAFIASFSLGLSTLMFVIPGEVFPSRYRAKAMGIAWFINRLTSCVVTSSFLPLAESWTLPGVFSIYAAIAGLGVFFVSSYVPETSAVGLEEIVDLFESKEQGSLNA